MDVPGTHRDAASGRRLSALDRLLIAADGALRAATERTTQSDRPNPAACRPENPLDDAERAHAARLMRVNHAGEVAAQALYEGQAATAREPALRRALRRAAREEHDHLAWCDERVRELGAAPSALSPLWYAGSFAIGALAGLAGDRHSLGFLAETERQVVQHLAEHLKRLPADDARSRAVLEAMQADEARHGQDAQDAGGVALPAPIPRMMRITAGLMTRTAYWL
jgi:3-demethoxyubiquinol 3-hydroxylase